MTSVLNTTTTATTRMSWEQAFDQAARDPCTYSEIVNIKHNFSKDLSNAHVLMAGCTAFTVLGIFMSIMLGRCGAPWGVQLGSGLFFGGAMVALGGSAVVLRNRALAERTCILDEDRLPKEGHPYLAELLQRTHHNAEAQYQMFYNQASTLSKTYTLRA